MSGRAKTWVVVLILLILIALYVGWHWTRPAATLAAVRPRIETIREFITEQAVTELPQDYLISMPINGWLETIDLREGDPVKAGQIVARVETADLADHIKEIEGRMAALQSRIDKSADNRLEDNLLIQANASVKALDETVHAAQARSDASKALADFAQYELDRVKKIASGEAASSRELREAETAARRAWGEHQSDVFQLAALKTINAVSHIFPKLITDYVDIKSYDRQQYHSQLLEAKAQLEITKRSLDRAAVKSSIDGVVLTRLQTRRQFLTTGTPLLTLGRLEDMEIIAEILTEQATHISPGDPVQIIGQGIMGEPIPGKVLRVYPQGFKKISSLGVEQQRVNVAIKMDHRPPRVGVAYRVEVRIDYAKAANALTVPRLTLFRSEQGSWQVLVVRGGVTALQDVTVGLKNDDRAQILRGLNSADLVVAQPSQNLEPNLRVRTVPAD